MTKKLTKSIPFKVTEETYKEARDLQYKYKGKFKISDICREALETAIKEYTEDSTIVDLEIEHINNKINKIETDINILNKEKITLESELSKLHDWKNEIEANTKKGDSRIMKVISAVTRLKHEYMKGKSPLDDCKPLIVRLSSETHLDPSTLNNLAYAYFTKKITMEDLELLDEDLFIDELDRLESIDKKGILGIKNNLTRHPPTYTSIN